MKEDRASEATAWEVVHTLCCTKASTSAETGSGLYCMKEAQRRFLHCKILLFVRAIQGCKENPNLGRHYNRK